MLYVDKTAHCLALLQQGRRYFLARPRRFGKSLTISTLEAMVAGKKELFQGLACSDWVCQQADHPWPVLRIDMSSLRRYTTAEELNSSLIKNLQDYAFFHSITTREEDTCDGMLLQVIYALSKKNPSIAVLIDEYDKPILDNITDIKKVDEMREVLCSFYTVLKSCDEYLRFIFITGISKFSKIGVFSAMNNLLDISHSEKYGDIVGYTQEELENTFAIFIREIAKKMNITTDELAYKLKEYYNGFSFDGVCKVYNPYSILSFFSLGQFGNYWYESASPTFIIQWLMQHKIEDPEAYRHVQVKNDFTNSREIEYADPKSFLFQSGYLTIEKKDKELFILDYPNKEVISAISSIYLEKIYKIDSFASLGSKIWKALDECDLAYCIDLYNIALSAIPYEDFTKRDEYWYRSLFVMLLRGAGCLVFAEVHVPKGRSDVCICTATQCIIFEFKLAKTKASIKTKREEGQKQLREKEYAKAVSQPGHAVHQGVVVACDALKKAIFFAQSKACDR